MKRILARLVFAFSCILILFLIQGIVAYRNIETISNIQAEAYNHQLQIKDIEFRLASARLLVLKILGTMNPTQMDRLNDQFKKDRSYLERAMAGENIDKRTIEKNFETYSEIIDLHYNFSVRTARRLINTQSKAIHEALVTKLRSLSQVVEKDSAYKIKITYQRTLRFTFGLLVLGLAIAILLALILARTLIDRQQAAIELKKSEEKYRTLVNTAPYGIQLTDLKGEIILSNPAHHKIHGYNDGELVGKYVWDLIAEESHKKKTKEYYQHIIREEIEPEIYFSLDRTKDGRLVDTQINWDYIRNANREIEGIISIIKDITDIKRMEQELRQARKMESIGTLAGGISHDFNNILHMIVGNAELALEDTPEWNPVHNNLKEINAAALRAAGIVKQLLNFSRKTEQELIPMDAMAIIEDALKFLRSTIPTTIDMRTSLPQEKVTILADPIQINQVLMNLCTNASQAMEETGGILDINAEAVILGEDAAANYPQLTPGDYLRIRISDTGPGINQGIIDRIFDPYFTTKDIGKGSGMGLAVVHGIVKNHGGDITVANLPGGGAAFTLFFPVVPAKPVRAEPPPGRHPPW